MKKTIITSLLTITFSSLVYSQVGINTPNPLGTLHVDGAKDNPATGTPNAAQSANDVVVTSAGNIGAGTTSPLGRLHLYNPTTGTDAGDDYLFDDESAISRVHSLLLRRSNAGANLVQNNVIGSVLFNPKISGAFAYVGAGISGIYRGNGTNQLSTLSFLINNNNEAARIDENGNMGIGTTTPTNRLDLGTTNGGGDATAVIGKKLALFNNAAGTDFYGLGINTGILQFHAGSIPTAAPAMVLTAAGRVGIGTVAPAERLSVVDAGNANQFQGTASFWANNLTRGVGIGYGGIQAIGSNPTADLNLNAKATGNIIMQNSGATGNVGIGATPTDKLDVNGTTRVRSIPVAAGPVVVTPVYSDASGVLSKAVNTAYGTVINSSVTVAAGATGALITGIGGNYKAVVSTSNGCGYSIFAEYYVAASAFNNNFAIKGIDGLLSSSNTKGPTFTETNRFTSSTTWTGLSTCQDGSGTGALNYTLIMPSAGTINITNNGNTSKTYQIILTRIN